MLKVLKVCMQGPYFHSTTQIIKNVIKQKQMQCLSDWVFVTSFKADVTWLFYSEGQEQECSLMIRQTPFKRKETGQQCPVSKMKPQTT